MDLFFPFLLIDDEISLDLSIGEIVVDSRGSSRENGSRGAQGKTDEERKSEGVGGD